MSSSTTEGQGQGAKSPHVASMQQPDSGDPRSLQVYGEPAAGSSDSNVQSSSAVAQANQLLSTDTLHPMRAGEDSSAFITGLESTVHNQHHRSHQGFDTPAFQGSSETFNKQQTGSNLINTTGRSSEAAQTASSGGIKPYQSAGVSNFARYNEQAASENTS